MKHAVLLLTGSLLLSPSLNVTATTLYVDASNPAPVMPFTNWITAATNIQDAVDAAVAGDEILVTNGVYEAGASALYGMSNRVAVTKPVTVKSVNGPGVTVIGGYGPNGSNAVRCVYLTNGAVLAGFTLTNGATQSSGDVYAQESGGAVWCESGSAVVSNCMVVGNSGDFAGGGAYQGTLNNCTLSSNSAFLGGGAYSGTLNNSSLSNNSAGYGGGSYDGTLIKCTVTDNSAAYNGGGACYGTLNNCTLVGNSADQGGGAYSGTLNNCTLSGNSANYAGGALGSTLNNCVVYYNTAPVGANSDSDLAYGSSLNYCCTTPLPGSGTGNFTNAPLFVDQVGGNLRLQTNSPCINAGFNAYAPGATDLDGNPRIRGVTVDAGAYEFQSPSSVISYAWLQSYGLPTDGLADYVDTDHDGMNNWQEWVAGTDPTNAASVLRLQAPIINPSSLLLRWSSDTNHAYFVQRATSLKTPLSFTTLLSDITGLPGTTAYTDATASPSNGAAFYRVGTGSSNGPSPVLLQLPVFVPASMTLTWTSVTNRTYFVQRATNLSPPPAFSLLQTNIPGLLGTTSFADTNLPVSGPAFYRIGVQP